MILLRNKSPRRWQPGRKIVKKSPLQHKALETEARIGGSPSEVTPRQLNYKALAHNATGSGSMQL
jgi:hypothetical protein